MELVTIKSIRVEELFDQFSYEIDLSNPGNVSVIIGPNGCGKTTMLNILSFLLYPRVEALDRIAKVPFKIFECQMSDGTQMTLERVKKEGKRVIAFSHLSMQNVDEFIFGSSYDWELKLRKGAKSWKIRSNRDLKISEEFKYFSDLDKEEKVLRYKCEFCGRLRAWLYSNDLTQDGPVLNQMLLHTLFIQSSRLDEEERIRFNPLHGDEQVKKWTVSPLKELDQNITGILTQGQMKYEEYMDKARILLPGAYLKADYWQPALSREEFKSSWVEYCDRLQFFRDIGFLDGKSSHPDIGDLDEAYDRKGVFLCVYLKMFKKTLEPLTQAYETLRPFAEIIDKRNEATQKRLQFTRDGVKMLANGRLIDIDCLSSGEKNDLVLFYQLLFKAKDTIIFIDEPEISWHIVWQEEFLDQLLEICRLRNLQAIVTTHSPNIINGHFELVAQRSEC